MILGQDSFAFLQASMSIPMVLVFNQFQYMGVKKVLISCMDVKISSVISWSIWSWGKNLRKKIYKLICGALLLWNRDSLSKLRFDIALCNTMGSWVLFHLAFQFKCGFSLSFGIQRQVAQQLSTANILSISKFWKLCHKLSMNGQAELFQFNWFQGYTGVYC